MSRIARAPLRVADEEVVDVERDVKGNAAGVDQLPDVGLDFAALEANLGERGRVALHPEVACLLGPLERAEKSAQVCTQQSSCQQS